VTAALPLYRRFGPRKTPPTLLALGAIAVVLLFAGPASASQTVKGPTLVHFHAPYAGASGFDTTPAGQNCNPTGSFALYTVQPRAHVDRGEVVGAGLAWANATAGGSCKTEIGMTGGFFGPDFIAPYSGNHTVTFYWNVTWTINVTLSGFPGSVDAVISLFGNLFDNTTGTWVLGGTSNDYATWTNLNASTSSCASSSHSSWLCADHVSQDVRFQINVSLHRGDQYLLYSGMSFSAVAHAKSRCFHGCRSGSADIEVNLGSGGNLAKLRSITAP
jgi:hypothetical protein